MYQREVPLYGDLLELVATINQSVLGADPLLRSQLASAGHAQRLAAERHGAIRLGTAEELKTMRRILAVMGMQPVGYYDLSAAGLPVHATAFRPTERSALEANPFRLFVSLIRLDLISDASLLELARQILNRRRIFPPRLLELLQVCEASGPFDADEAKEFVFEALNVFRWHSTSEVSQADYARVLSSHRLVADVVCFKGPHINHLTPRVLDIEAAHREMTRRGIPTKSNIEGPPRRSCPILLRQTSFKAMEEPVTFAGGLTQGSGTHTARFGEIEQRGQALTRKGRELYDRLLLQARNGEEREVATNRLSEVFQSFPNDLEVLRRQELGFFRYRLADGARNSAPAPSWSIDDLIRAGWIRADPIVYEDFLPASAAGIFQSNLGNEPADASRLDGVSAKEAFEEALGAPVLDEFRLYEAEQHESIAEVRRALGMAEAP